MTSLQEEFAVGWGRRQWAWENKDMLLHHAKWQHEIWLMDQMGTAQVIQEVTGFEHETRFPGSQMLDWLAQDKSSRCQLYLEMSLGPIGNTETENKNEKKRL